MPGLTRTLWLKVLGPGLVFTAKANQPWLAAGLLRVCLRRLQPRQQRKSYRLLILSKPGFKQDVLTSLEGDPRFEVYGLEVVTYKVFKILAAMFLPADIDDNNYFSKSPDDIQCKARYRSFLARMWRQLQRLLRVDAVLTANFSYYAERELAAALEALGIPFIVLHKENLKSPGRVDFFKRIYQMRRGAFSGRKILVYNEMERQLQIEAGIVSPERVVVTGMPRLDKAHRWRQQQAQRSHPENPKPQVLFLSFGPKTGLPFIARKPRSEVQSGYERLEDDLAGLNWECLSQRCHQAMVRLARELPEVNVVVKMKGRHQDAALKQRLLGKENILPENLNIVMGGDAFELIRRSQVVCGFNTTGILEAIAIGKPVICPRFDEALEPRMQSYIADFEDVVDYADSPEQLVKLIKEKLLNPCEANDLSLDAHKRHVLDKWAGNADGQAGARVKQALLAELSQRGSERSR